ncbi:MAG: NAD+ synthase [bacterium]
MNNLSITMAQIRTKPGSVWYNHDVIVKYIKMAADQVDNTKPQLLVFPEMAIPGYPALDLYLNSEFIRNCEKSLNDITKITGDYPNIMVVVGSLELLDDRLYNSAYVLNAGQVKKIVRKTLLPEYDIFFEKRYFNSAPITDMDNTIYFYGNKIGILVCEDLWDENYSIKPFKEKIIKHHADVVVSINASPYCIGKVYERIKRVKDKIRNTNIDKFVYVNAIGGQDGYEGEIVFDGNSFIVDNKGKMYKEGGAYEKSLTTIYPDAQPEPVLSTKWQNARILRDEMGDVFGALTMGVKHYFARANTWKAVIGISGGIDSAVVAWIAAQALGQQNIKMITMPSQYSSKETLEDAFQLMKNLGGGFNRSINSIYRRIYAQLDTNYEDRRSLSHEDINPLNMDIKDGDLTSQNIQARIRGIILMAYANANNAMVISTGNKTELALGYCTLYGDMAGGISPLADLNKLNVYHLADYINHAFKTDACPYPIPLGIIKRPPSAELASDQTDEATLGDYNIIAPLVDQIVSGDYNLFNLKMDYGADVVQSVAKKIFRNEFKRRQSPPGIKNSRKAFGSGRRMPWSIDEIY